MSVQKKKSIPGEAPPGFRDRFWLYIDPGMLTGKAVLEFVKTTLRIIFVERSPLSVLNINSLRSQAFADFWQSISSPPFKPQPGKTPPPLEGSLSLLTPHLPSINGVVLDLGPGTGHLMHYYPASNISAIYAAEPTEGLHNAIRNNADAVNFHGKYHILTCGAETSSLVPGLQKAGLLKEGSATEGVFDAIIAARVLCGVPDLKESLKTLYLLLKPGGKLIISEHVVNSWWTDPHRGGILGRLLQVIYKPLWEVFVRCHLDCDTERLLLEVGEENGGWERVDLKGRVEWGPLPWVGGALVKKL